MSSRGWPSSTPCRRTAAATCTGAPVRPVASPAGAVDLARLAHHADAAGDAAAVLRFAPAAARDAASIGAHREAAAQYQRALRFNPPPAQRADLLEGLSYACYLTDQADESIHALRQAIVLRREAGDWRAEGAALSSLSRRLWCGGYLRDAALAGVAAVKLLEGRAEEGHELALAYSNLAQLALNDERLDDTATWSQRALDLAQRIEDTDVIVHSLNNVGTAKLLAGETAGRADLERSLALAERAGLEEHIGRAFIHAGWVATRTRDYDLARWFDRGVEVCADLGLEGWRLYVQVYRARYHLDQGRWAEAVADATFVLESARTVPLLHMLALTVLALGRARRGEPDVWPALDEAYVLAKGHDELQFLAPVATARAEALWLEGRHGEVEDETSEVFELAVRRDSGWVVGELAWLRRLAGIRESAPGAAGPYPAQLAGTEDAAVREWTALGCPYDAALAGVASENEERLRASLTGFQRLGAGPAARVVARRLRQQGRRGVPRGPRPATRENPAHLTRREGQVLALVCAGCSNAEIAARLFLSERTVHHHVSAILRKLGVHSRTQAVSAARRLGVGDPPM
jgi:DNA-binding CsgD family transcriptional regulator/tetratricopeptide (TPR) repeat protein